MWSASGSGLTPSLLPSPSTRSTSRARIRSLILGSLLAGAVAMGFLLISAWPGREEGQAPESNARPTSGYPAHCRLARRRRRGRVGVGWPRFPWSFRAVGYQAVSSLWTPGGERPVPPPTSGGGRQPPPKQPGGPAPDQAEEDQEEELSAEEMQKRL